MELETKVPIWKLQYTSQFRDLLFTWQLRPKYLLLKFTVVEDAIQVAMSCRIRRCPELDGASRQKGFCRNENAPYKVHR